MAEASRMRVVVRTAQGAQIDADVPVRGNVGNLFTALGRNDLDLIVNGRFVTTDMATRSLESVGIVTALSCFHALPRDARRSARTQRAHLNPGQGPPAPAHVMESFFVYCANGCAAIRPARMRTCCAVCKSTAFVLARNTLANSWSDVLQPERFRGICHGPCGGEAGIETPAQFFFKCNDARHAGAAEDPTLPYTRLPVVKSNVSNKMSCPVHFGDEHVIRADFPCGHSICIDCFADHASIKINEKLLSPMDSVEGGFSVPCPMCPQSVIDSCNGRLFKILDPRVYEKFQSFATEFAVLAMEGGAVCPLAGCNGAFIDEESEGNKAHCPNCDGSHCRVCNNPWHDGACNMDRRRIEEALRAQSSHPLNPEEFERQLQDRLESERVLRESTKPCPQCGVQIFKDEGCNHMTCVRCSYEFCWVDMRPWTEGGECQQTHWFPPQY